MNSEEGSSTPPPHAPSHIIDQEEDDPHRPLSPPTPAESLFLPNVTNSHISAAALASSIHSVHSAKSRTGRSSIATEEFASACGDLSEQEEEEDLYDVQITRNNNTSSNNNYSGSLFGRDILFFSRQPIEEEDIEETSPTNSTKEVMSYKSKSKTKPVIVDKTVESKSLGSGTMNGTEDEAHFDVGTNVYEAAKGVWGWGKSIPLAGKVLGVYEAVGAKVVSTAVHKDLGTVDAEIKHHVSGLDKDVIDPAIAAILNIIFPAVEKGEEVLKPIIMAVGPKIPFMAMIFPQLLTNEASDPETSTPRLEVN